MDRQKLFLKMLNIKVLLGAKLTPGLEEWIPEGMRVAGGGVSWLYRKVS